MNPVQPQGCIKLESKNLSMPTSQDNNCLCMIYIYIYIYTHVRMYVCCIYVCVHMLFNTRIPSAMPKKKVQMEKHGFCHSCIPLRFVPFA